MRNFILFLLIFFIFSFDVYAQEVDFSGNFNGTSSDSFSGSGSYTGNDSGSLSSSGSGSISNTGSVSNYLVFVRDALTPSTATGDSTSSNFIFSTIGNQYYINSSTGLKNISNISQVSSTTIYRCYHKPTGANFYTFTNGINSDCYVPHILSLGNGSSNFTFDESGSYTGKESGSLNFNGSSSGSIKGTFSGVAEAFGRSFSYPPAFPVVPNDTYSTIFSNGYIKSLNLKSNGVILQDGYDFGFLNVTYLYYFSSPIDLPVGNYFMQIFSGGYSSGQPSFPTVFSNPDTYCVNAEPFYGLTPLSFNQGSNWWSNDISFFLSRQRTQATVIEFNIEFFVTENVSSFDITYDMTGNFGQIYTNDTSSILKQLQNQNNSLTSAGGANSGMNSQNQLVNSALSDYQNQTDTSTQYGNISDTLFVPDVSVFTQIAPTISLFSSVITGLFTHLGDLSVPLTMFLVFVFISSVLGIHNFVVSSNDRMDSKSSRFRSREGKKGD